MAFLYADEYVYDISSGNKETQGSRDPWTWRTLTALYVEDVCVTSTLPTYLPIYLNKSLVLLAIAENDNGTFALTPDAEEASSVISHCLLIGLEISSSDVQLRELGQLRVSGPAAGVGFLQEQDGGIVIMLTDF